MSLGRTRPVEFPAALLAKMSPFCMTWLTLPRRLVLQLPSCAWTRRRLSTGLTGLFSSAPLRVRALGHLSFHGSSFFTQASEVPFWLMATHLTFSDLLGECARAAPSLPCFMSSPSRSSQPIFVPIRTCWHPAAWPQLFSPCHLALHR